MKECSIVHDSSEYVGELPFPPLKDVQVPLKNQSNEIEHMADRILETQIGISSQQQLRNLVQVSKTRAWGIQTEIDVLDGSITYRWAFKPHFRGELYEVNIFRTRGETYPEGPVCMHGDIAPFVQSCKPHIPSVDHIQLDADPGSTYVHTAVLREFTTGDVAEYFRFTRRIPKKVDGETTEGLDNLRKATRTLFSGRKKNPINLKSANQMESNKPLSPAEKAVIKTKKRREQLDILHKNYDEGIAAIQLQLDKGEITREKFEKEKEGFEHDLLIQKRTLDLL